jgi:uncharacterized protein (DUF1778 family)
MTSLAERKSQAINLRMAPSTKELLRALAEKEHRTLSNMLEVLILEHAAKAGITPAAASTRARRTSGKTAKRSSL